MLRTNACPHEVADMTNRSAPGFDRNQVTDNWPRPGRQMQALMQEWSLTLDKLLEHAAKWHGKREIVTRSAEGPITRTRYADVHARAKQLSNALKGAGIAAGDRVATLAWNSARHLEVCYGVIGIGAVHHTLNPRLFPEQLIYIVN